MRGLFGVLLLEGLVSEKAESHVEKVSAAGVRAQKEFTKPNQ